MCFTFVGNISFVMSTYRLQTLTDGSRENISGARPPHFANKSCTTLKSEDQPCRLETDEISCTNFAEVFCEEDELKALDDLSDSELDELLGRALTLNKRLKQHLNGESMLINSTKDKQPTPLNLSRARGRVVLPPIVKRTPGVTSRLKANR